MRITISCLLSCIFLTVTLGYGQSMEKFEGVVTYQYTKLPKGVFPIVLEKITVTNNVFYQQVVQTRNEISLADVLCDLANFKRYQIDHQSKTIVDLGVEPSAEVELINEEHFPDTIFRGDSCSVLQFIRHDPPNEVVYTYFLSKTKEIENIATLAALQGNQNTKILDGRFKTLPLLVMMRLADGSMIRIEAVKVEPLSEVPDFEFRDYKR